MKSPKNHKKEKERLQLLESYSILDTLPEEDFDNLTTLAAEICNTPVSLVSLLDDKRQWFKSHHGLDASETKKEYAFCGHAINEPDNVFMIEDARKDDRFYDNPLVTGDPHVIFYAGVPLKDSTGLPLGTLCVIDHKPKVLSQSQINSLNILSNQVMNLLELRKKKMQLEEANAELEQNNLELEKFAYIAAHDLKSPLNNISALAELLQDNYDAQIDENGQNIIEHIKSSSETLKRLIENLLDYSKSSGVSTSNSTKIDLNILKDDIAELFSAEDKCNITLKSKLAYINTNKTAVEQILINLFANAIKYNDKAHTSIELKVEALEEHYKISVKDNGPGIAKEHKEKIFKIFETLSNTDKFGQSGTGIGLATVKKVVNRLGGEIYVKSELGHGSTFIFTLEKQV